MAVVNIVDYAKENGISIKESEAKLKADGYRFHTYDECGWSEVWSNVPQVSRWRVTCNAMDQSFTEYDYTIDVDMPVDASELDVLRAMSDSVCAIRLKEQMQ